MSKVTTAADEVYLKLRTLVAEGRLAPGSRLVEADLARRLGVSRTPVRTALTRLQQERYVESIDAGRRSRLAVTPLTRADSRELYWVVGELEGLAARWAAGLDDDRREELSEELQSINEELLRATELDHPTADRLFKLDAKFHRTYVEVDGSWPRLSRIHKALKPHTERYWRLYTGASTRWIHKSHSEHDEILTAIAEGNEEEAARAAQMNWRNGAERLVAIIDNWGERGNW